MVLFLEFLMGKRYKSWGQDFSRVSNDSGFSRVSC